MARLGEDLSKLYCEPNHPELAEKNHYEPNQQNGICSNSGNRIRRTDLCFRRVQQIRSRQHRPNATGRRAR
jgi:hypothetical protein